MHSKINAWLFVLLGILLILPVVGITQLGDISMGITSWLVPIIFIIIGVVKLMKPYKK